MRTITSQELIELHNKMQVIGKDSILAYIKDDTKAEGVPLLFFIERNTMNLVLADEPLERVPGCIKLLTRYLDTNSERHVTSNRHIKLLGFGGVKDFTCFFTNMNFRSIDLSDTNFSSAVTLNKMFQYCSIDEVYMGVIKNSCLRDISEMFCNSKIGFIDSIHIESPKLNTVKAMFKLSTIGTSLDLTNLNTESVIDFSYMFSQSNIIGDLDISSFKIKNNADLTEMFNRAIIKKNTYEFIKDPRLLDMFSKKLVILNQNADRMQLIEK